MKRLGGNEDIDPYNNLFCNLLEKNYNSDAHYQQDEGDWMMGDGFRSLKKIPRYPLHMAEPA